MATLLLPLLLAASPGELAASPGELAASPGEGVGEAVRNFLTSIPATAQVTNAHWGRNLIENPGNKVTCNASF